MKLRYRKSFVTIISLISITVVSVVFQGCQEEYLNESEELPYLELSSLLEGNVMPADYEILKQAQVRLAKYVSSEDGKFVLKLESGNPVNISNNLFEYFQSTISNANNILKDGNYEIKGHLIRKKSPANISRLKSGVTEDHGDYYVAASGIDYTWYGMNINVSHEDVAEFQAGTFGSSYLLSKYRTGVPQVDAWIQSAEAVTFFTGLLSSVYDNGDGFSIVCILYVPTYAVTY